MLEDMYLLTNLAKLQIFHKSPKITMQFITIEGTLLVVCSDLCPPLACRRFWWGSQPVCRGKLYLFGWTKTLQFLSKTSRWRRASTVSILELCSFACFYVAVYCSLKFTRLPNRFPPPEIPRRSYRQWNEVSKWSGEIHLQSVSTPQKLLWLHTKIFVSVPELERPGS